MSENPNLKCRYCGTERNVKETKIQSFSIITCFDCIHKLPVLYGDSKFNLKTRIKNYFKRLKLRCLKVELP